MKLQNTELLNTQTSAEVQDSKQSSQLIEREKFDDNPFELVNRRGNIYSIGFLQIDRIYEHRRSKRKNSQ